MNSYEEFRRYVPCVRDALIKHGGAAPLSQLDYDVGYDPRIADVVERVSERGWHLYKPNVRLALAALIYAGEVRAGPLIAFELTGAPPLQGRELTVDVAPGDHETWRPFMTKAISAFGAWANERLDLGAPQVNDELMGRGDIFQRLRQYLKDASPERVVQLTVSSGFCSDRAKFEIARDKTIYLITASQLNEYGAPLKFLCVYDADPERTIDDALIKYVRDYAVGRAYNRVQLMSNSLVATTRALLRASFAEPEMLVFGCGEVVANTFLADAGRNPTLYRDLGAN